jgi:hypothetical protein
LRNDSDDTCLIYLNGFIMKKIFLSAIMLAAAYTLCAQEVGVYKATTIKPAEYQVPVIITTHFQTTYPGVTPMAWEPMNDWWYTTYKDNNNRLVRVYYSTQPYYLIRNESSKVALPVINTMVPEAVITSAINTYGNNLYSITALKSAGSNDLTYQVTLIKNGVAETAMLNATGVVYSAPVQP